MTILRNLPIDAYHAHAALSNSKISDFLANGAAWWKRRYIDRVIPGKNSAALKEGRLFDTVLFEGDAGLARDYRLQPDTYMAEPKKKGEPMEEKPWNLNSNTCKAIVAEAQACGQLLVSQADLANANRMLAAVRAHPLAMELLSLCEYQVSIRTRMNGVEIQARPDGLSRGPCSISEGLRFTLDAKKTACWSDWFNESDPDHPHAGSPIYTYGYHRQGSLDNVLCAMEPDIGNTKHFLLVVEDAEPYRVAVVEMTETYLDAGWSELEHAIGRLARFITGAEPWPGSPQQLITMHPPRWLTDRADRLVGSVVV